MVTFKNSQESHAHSLSTLNDLYEHDDFMESVGRVLDLGCGYDALDLQWWATRTTRDDVPLPLNIQCTGIDLIDNISREAKQTNVTYQRHDLENIQSIKRPYDILWCHDTFQYMINPLQCLINWRNLCTQNGMLILILPQTTNIEFNRQAFDQPSGCYYNHTMVSLIHMLAVTGWDCRGGFFKKAPNDPWLHAIVYKSDQGPSDPRNTSWYGLAEKGLLPSSAEESINKYGYLRQHDLVLPWIDKSLSWMGHQ
jgi:SAM-dependent methyltransferase